MNNFVRKNTIEFKFERGKERPMELEVYRWLSEEIGLNVDQVDGIQFDIIQNAVYVKIVEELVVDRCIERCGDEKFMKTSKEEQIKVTIRKCTDSRKIVRVLTLPLGFENKHVTETLNQYGKVETVKDETTAGANPYFPGVRTGVKIVSIILKKPIPSCIEIQGCKTLVTYSGQTRTCVECNATDHFRLQCPKLRLAETRFQRLKDMSKENAERVLPPAAPGSAPGNPVLTFADVLSHPVSTKIVPSKNSSLKKSDHEDVLVNLNKLQKGARTHDHSSANQEQLRIENDLVENGLIENDVDMNKIEQKRDFNDEDNEGIGGPIKRTKKDQE